jgi:hypothetical protein
MLIWALIVLVLSLLGFTLNAMAGIDLNLLLHDALLGLLALGILVRVRYKMQKGEKENLHLEISRLREEKYFLTVEMQMLQKKVEDLKSFHKLRS